MHNVIFSILFRKDRLGRWGGRVVLHAEWCLECTKLWQEMCQSSDASHLVLNFCVMFHLLECSMGKKSGCCYFSLSKTLNRVSHMVLTAKLVSEQGKGTVRWVEKWEDCGAKVVTKGFISNTVCSWRLVIGVCHRDWNQHCSRFLLMTWMTGWHSASSWAERNCCGAGVFDILEVRMPSEGPQQAEKGTGWKGTAWHSKKENVKSCIWDGITCADWGQQDRKLFRKRSVGSKSVVCPCSKECQPHTGL